MVDPKQKDKALRRRRGVKSAEDLLRTDGFLAARLAGHREGYARQPHGPTEAGAVGAGEVRRQLTAGAATGMENSLVSLTPNCIPG